MHRGEQRPRYKIDGFTLLTADKSKFKDDQTNKEVTVTEYFKKQYHRQLVYGACLPCVVVKKKKDLYFPVEVCRILEGQRYKRQLGPRATADFIKIACTKPEERERRIRQDATRQMNFENNPDFKAWGMHIDTRDLMTLNARILAVPNLICDSASSKPHITIKDGAWNIQKFLVGSKLTSWAIAVFGSEQYMPTAAINDFIRQLVAAAAPRGLNIVNKTPILVRANSFEDPSVVLDRVYLSADYRDPATNQKVPPQLIMCLLDGKAKQSKLYSPCKKWGDCKVGAMTQCISYAQLQQQRSMALYCNNLVLKLNMKLGGVNFKLAPKTLGRWGDEPCMIIGCDVTHGPPGSGSPSIAVLAATMDDTFGRYAVEYTIQPPRREIIDNFGAMLKSLLNQFLSRSRTKPKRILVFRDGVSEGMANTIMEKEIDEIKKTCIDLSPKFQPEITVVAVQKRHHTRFFPTDQNRDRSQNCLPGTVVDTVIAHNYEFDFFLQSHAGIQGTSRPTHYQVLYDDFGFGADALQNFCYHLCFTYGRCMRSVSVVTPVFYADMAGYRIRTHLKDYSKWSTEDSKRTSDSQEDPSSYFEPLNPRLKGLMWFV
ncbi:Piwi domain-containing protein [Jimgerdemannia flammicorona]|uniref:Piwi domain-containing protein n=1 Tax=Jimgerdemannia flammicorona TaxID=994334 RepID=A0A433DEW0_9FUNG|nr:Piwi domain-containing protein [Jimgerdemannia flammicorona]